LDATFKGFFFMNDNQSSAIPVWVWVIGGCGLFSLIGACIIVALAFLGVGLFSAAVPTFSTPAVVVTVIPLTAVSGGSQSENDEATATVPPPATDTPPQTPTQPGVEVEETADSGPTGEDPNNEVRSQIEANVIELRGLPQLEAVMPTALTPAELRVRLETDLNEDYSPEESRLDVLSLSAFDIPKIIAFEYLDFGDGL
jgi:hypothetical protein